MTAGAFPLEVQEAALNFVQQGVDFMQHINGLIQGRNFGYLATRAIS